LVAIDEEEEENLFAKKAGCLKGLQPINAGYHTHNKNRPNVRKHKHAEATKSMSSV